MKRFNVVKPSITILTTIIFGVIFPLLPIVLILHGFIISGISFLVLWLFNFFFAVIHNCYIKHIIIDCKGITYRSMFNNYHMRWDEIASIGILYMPIKAPGIKPWIYITNIDIPIISINPRMANDNFFMLNYRKEIILEILKYWKGEIKGKL